MLTDSTTDTATVDEYGAGRDAAPGSDSGPGEYGGGSQPDESGNGGAAEQSAPTGSDTGRGGTKGRTPSARTQARAKLAARREAARARERRIEDSLTTLLSNSSRMELIEHTRDVAIATAYEEFERAADSVRSDMADAVGTLRTEGLTLDEIAEESDLSAQQVRELNKRAREAGAQESGEQS